MMYFEKFLVNGFGWLKSHYYCKPNLFMHLRLFIILLLAVVIGLFVKKFWDNHKFDRAGFERVALTEEEEDTLLSQEYPSRRYALNSLLQDYFYQ